MELPARVLFRAIGYDRDFPMGFSYPAGRFQQVVQAYGGPEQFLRALQHDVLGITESPTPTPGRAGDELPARAPRGYHQPSPTERRGPERAYNIHGHVQHALADRAEAHGYEVLSPGPGDPDFDVAWRLPDGRLAIVEVKSLAPRASPAAARIGANHRIPASPSAHRRGRPRGPCCSV